MCCDCVIVVVCYGFVVVCEVLWWLLGVCGCVGLCELELCVCACAFVVMCWCLCVYDCVSI